MKSQLLALFGGLLLAGCNSTNEGNTDETTSPTYLTQSIVDIEHEQLSQYWVRKPHSYKANQRPKWLPKKGKGIYFFETVIDSNGREVSRTLVRSFPEDWMSQALLDKMPVHKYSVAAKNKNKTPVRFVQYASLLNKSDNAKFKEIMKKHSKKAL